MVLNRFNLDLNLIVLVDEGVDSPIFCLCCFLRRLLLLGLALSENYPVGLLIIFLEK